MTSPDGAHNLGTARADQTREADDFAFPHVEVDVLIKLAAGEVLDLEDRITDGAVALRIDAVHLAADHHGDDRGRIDLGNGIRADEAAVAHDRYVVAEREDLFHLVRDVEDGAALVAHLLDLLKQTLRLVLRQRRRWLVHNNDLRVLAGRLDDLQQLDI